jgi:hypothetical protein
VREGDGAPVRAFGANPRDPRSPAISASLYLKVTPAAPGNGAQLALVALAARGPQYTRQRMEDWQTFAIAAH